MSAPELKKAFAVSAYLALPKEQIPDRITSDLSALALETGTRVPGVTYFDSVVPKDQLSWDTPENRQASLAALDTRRLIETTTAKSVVIWLSPESPQYGYPDSRLNLFFVTNTAGRIDQENYGIRLPYKLNEAAQLHTRLIYLSDTPGLPPMHDEHDIRSTPLRIPLETASDFYSIAPQLIPLEKNIWDYITSGQAKADKLAAEISAGEAAVVLAQSLLGLAKPGEIDLLRLGARAEKHLIDSGWDMQGDGSGCGLLNSEILARSSSPSSAGLSGEMVFVRHCGVCCLPINSGMKAGDACPNCHGIFPGVSAPSHPAAAPRVESALPPDHGETVVFFGRITSWSWLSDWWKTISVPA